MAAALRKPDFLIVGTQKAGTSWLKDHLGAHPDVGMVRGTPHYFDKGWRDTGGEDTYLSLFAGMDRAMVGEKTTEYLDVTDIDGIPARMASMNPDMKLIAILRDPVTRALSAFDHIITSGLMPIPDDPVRALHDDPNGHNFIPRGDYAPQIEGIFRSFPRDQLLVLGFEDDIAKNPAQGLRKAQDFLGIAPQAPSESLDKPVNKRRLSPLGISLSRRLVNVPYARSVIARLDRLNPAPPYRSQWPDDLRPQLAEHYATPNERLFTLLGKRFDGWTTP